MPKAKNSSKPKGKVYSVPTARRQKDGGVPKLTALKSKAQTGRFAKARPERAGGPTSIHALASTSRHAGDNFIEAVEEDLAPVDASLTVRDSSAKAFMRELRKVIERADVIIQVLDARDPEGTRSKWVEEEVRKRDSKGKKLIFVINKIDLVPIDNLQSWLKHLKHTAATWPFKSSTQSQRGHLSQATVPLTAQSVPGQKQTLRELPQTSSSMGATELLGALKQYALSTPHSALTVGVVGYPNVGKSSLINSLKRSRACGVAAMPGKTRVVQEVVLDKGVKILDCPGVVLEDIRDLASGDSKRKQAEMMLRNAVKAELVEDPVAPIDVVLERADPQLLMNLYNLPPWDDTKDFLIKLALTRGRLGRGGIPDLEAAAVQVLRDWNSGKIPYYTRPPAVHTSSKPQEAAEAADADADVAMDGARVGDAKILNNLSEAFTLDGLFDDIGGEGDWDGEEGDAGFVADEMEEDVAPPSAPALAPVAASASAWAGAFSPASSASSPVGRSISLSPPPFPTSTFNPSLKNTRTFNAPARAAADPTRLFTAEERAALPTMSGDKQKAKKEAKKAKKRRAAAEQTEGELLLGFMGMDVDETAYEPPKTAKQRRIEKKERKEVREVRQVDVQVAKERDFASFLAAMGEDEDEL
ncbi:hypothetical protein CcaverHIS002_0212490 [Cutaneotrichosporon cavernicola]|uniref:CP-type G domain-containing protein n=1 Tax=Cutaneotrichosporon cavernicola TaxID=279322 RepID=A0AA48L212_9TREE|nr:uncharacterized protein CcaverHIS019_0212490 [Cutaneotrichosporon cavernicola]BEI82089.1 hypothetical protein CcaverHIS002_0212490 [Cutaneotrichosporon cavernicola]BEI89887.1 hypothetical protein CcaverHIS019_0212490 [Cutaneotrichosporon cavernicola]BEI97658.1 hypothetical protein CcaverHIS631_0212470 [Cutaneotrichosporon cavernicola]BEJ05435.1 hypothetical protein CcaverHIS641_0212520 [Cutaneotrichosporon cavernicola]